MNLRSYSSLRESHYRVTLLVDKTCTTTDFIDQEFVALTKSRPDFQVHTLQFQTKTVM